MNIDFSDISYLIHFRNDVPERRRNLLLVNEFLKKHTSDHEIIVAWEYDEDDEFDEGDECSVAFDIPTDVESVKYDHNSIIGGYHRTRGFNLAFNKTDRPIVILGDTDCIVNPQHIRDSADHLLKNMGVCVCHGGHFIEIKESSEAFHKFDEDLDIKHFEELKYPARQFFDTHEFHVRQLNSLGGCVAVSSEYYKLVPECEHFVGWGYEDDHRVQLAHKLGAYAGNNPNGVFYHLPHESANRSPEPFYEQRNSQIHNFMRSLTAEQASEYIATWNAYQWHTPKPTT